MCQQGYVYEGHNCAENNICCLCPFRSKKKTKDLPSDLKNLLPEHGKYLEHVCSSFFVFPDYVPEKTINPAKITS